MPLLNSKGGLLRNKRIPTQWDASLALRVINNSIIDISPNRSPLTVVGNVQPSFVQSKFGDGSVYFPGNDYLQYSRNISLSDYTLESWVYLLQSRSHALFAGGNYGDTEFVIFPSDIRIARANISWDVITNYTVPLNQWVHIAYSRGDSTQRIFIDGNQISSGNYSQPINIAATARIGAATDTFASAIVRNAFGYFDRLTLSPSGKYTANFTPPTS